MGNGNMNQVAESCTSKGYVHICMHLSSICMDTAIFDIQEVCSPMTKVGLLTIKSDNNLHPLIKQI